MTVKYKLSEEVLSTQELETGKRYFFIGVSGGQEQEGVSSEQIAEESFMIERTDATYVYGKTSSGKVCQLINSAWWREVVVEREKVEEVCVIRSISYNPVSGYFKAELWVFDMAGNKTGKVELQSLSLDRLVDMMRPSDPENL